MNAKSILLTSGPSNCEILPDRGALVTKLRLGDTEILWMPNDFSPEQSSWPGGGLPICFPFAGRVWASGNLYHYNLKGTTYPMPLHGFAFASSFQQSTLEKNSATLVLVDSPGSRQLYPFAFSLSLLFTLEETALVVKATIKNSSQTTDDMPVALGWHPYFNLEKSDVATLSASSRQYHVVTPVGAAGKRSETSQLGPKPWSIHQPLFNSLILTDLESAKASLTAEKQPRPIHLESGPKGRFPHLVLWSNQLNQFYCVEPWMSLPDAVATHSGCHWLKPGDSLDCWMKISV